MFLSRAHTTCLSLANASLVLLAGLTSPVLAQDETTIEYYGYYTRSDYVRIERTGSGRDATTTIVLSQFLRSEESRLRVTSIKSNRSYPTTTTYTAPGNGEPVSVSVTTGGINPNARPIGMSIRFGNSDPRLVSPLAAPTVETRYHGYVNRSEYVRVESWTSEGETSESIVTSSFGRPTENRYRVTSHQILESHPSQEEIRAEDRFSGTTVEFLVVGTQPPSASFRLNDGPRQTVTLLP